MNRVIEGIIAASLVLGLGGCSVGTSLNSPAPVSSESVYQTQEATPEATLFEEAGDYCGVDVVDDGHSIVLKNIKTTKGAEKAGCVLGYTGSSEALLNKILSTTTLDGVQEESWDTEGGDVVTLTWRFHYSSGLSLIFVLS